MFDDTRRRKLSSNFPKSPNFSPRAQIGTYSVLTRNGKVNIDVYHDVI